MRIVTCSLCVLALALVVVVNGCGSTAVQGGLQRAAPASGMATGANTSTLLTMRSQVQPANPRRLIIPSIGVNAAVEMVGILHDGNLATPSLSPWDDAGWYAAGPQPGEVGSAVIDGHLDRPGGSPAVFWNLRYMRVGDRVMITDTAWGTARFRVTRIALYHPRQAPIQEIFGDESGSYLNLITCAGDWLASQHQTALRLVVYTTLVR
jgi:sortase (surface protein transpeptidase)